MTVMGEKRTSDNFFSGPHPNSGVAASILQKQRRILIMEADIAGFITIGFVVAFVAAQLLRTLRTGMTQRTLREAIQKGKEISPELLLDSERPQPAGSNDLRNGMVLIALAFAIVGFGLIQNSQDALRGTAGLSLFPLFVGVALLLRLRLVRDRGES